jgi:histidine triad (HIT) family protein
MNCLFCKIVEKTIPANIVFESDELVAFRDIAPQSPHHILIIPKKHIQSLNQATNDEQLLMGSLLLTAQKIAKSLEIENNGYRLVMNTGTHGGQTVEHIHLHLLAGRQMHWPPG